MRVLEQLSGKGFLLLGEERRSPISYSLAVTETDGIRSVKGVLTDESRVEFDGMIRIRPRAQQTASFLSAHTLLLGAKCRAEAIPGLESIYLITHDVDLALSHADRILVLRDGRVA